MSQLDIRTALFISCICIEQFLYFQTERFLSIFFKIIWTCAKSHVSQNQPHLTQIKLRGITTFYSSVSLSTQKDLRWVHRGRVIDLSRSYPLLKTVNGTIIDISHQLVKIYLMNSNPWTLNSELTWFCLLGDQTLAQRSVQIRKMRLIMVPMWACWYSWALEGQESDPILNNIQNTTMRLLKIHKIQRKIKSDFNEGFRRAFFTWFIYN